MSGAGIFDEDYEKDRLSVLDPDEVHEVYSDLSDGRYGFLGVDSEEYWEEVVDWLSEEDPRDFNSEDVDLDLKDQRIANILRHFHELELLPERWKSGTYFNTALEPDEWSSEKKDDTVKQDLHYVHSHFNLRSKNIIEEDLSQ